ncbi:MAG TPA: hypothetical protein VJX67_20650 [Blastocatellia bacterium]|nr:hypothetical protein [Blastocatellia bacterium]
MDPEPSDLQEGGRDNVNVGGNVTGSVIATGQGHTIVVGPKSRHYSVGEVFISLAVVAVLLCIFMFLIFSRQPSSTNVPPPAREQPRAGRVLSPTVEMKPIDSSATGKSGGSRTAGNHQPSER